MIADFLRRVVERLVAGILAVRGDTIDRAYVERWVTALDLRAQWDAVTS